MFRRKHFSCSEKFETTSAIRDLDMGTVLNQIFLKREVSCHYYFTIIILKLLLSNGEGEKQNQTPTAAAAGE